MAMLSGRPQPLHEIVGIRRRHEERVTYYADGGLDLKVSDAVIIEGAEGPELGRVVIEPRQLIHSDLAGSLPPVLRLATPQEAAKGGKLG